MTWIVVACAAVAVVVIALSLRSHAAPSPEHGGPDEPWPDEPKPGADLPRLDQVVNVPDGYVTLRTSLPAERAYVVHGLLVSGGIEAALQPARPVLHAYHRQAPTALSVLVPEERYVEADELLKGEELSWSDTP